MVGTSRETTSYSKATIACFCLLIGTVVTYLYFLNMSVVQVVLRTEHVQKQHDINAEMAQLESQYIDAQHTITSRIATLDGYEIETPKIFVSREAASVVLSRR